MSDRIYTIRARDAVPSMWHFGIDGCWRMVTAVKIRDGLVTLEDDEGISGQDADTSITVRFPGPSPRELLCTCCQCDRDIARAHGESFGGDVLPPECHEPDCPVRRLRLRLWPVGATWQEHEDGDSWHVPIEGLVPWRIDVQTLRDEFDEYVDVAQAMLRAAFCEPEVTP